MYSQVTAARWDEPTESLAVRTASRTYSLYISGYKYHWSLLTNMDQMTSFRAADEISRNIAAECFNTLRPRQNGRHFADDIFKCIFLNQNLWIPIKISLKVVPKGLINNIPPLVQIMAWRRPGDKPLSEPMMVRLKTHTCVTRPQWVNLCLLSRHTYFNVQRRSLC